jgi:hypothetical protein
MSQVRRGEGIKKEIRGFSLASTKRFAPEQFLRRRLTLGLASCGQLSGMQSNNMAVDRGDRNLSVSSNAQALRVFAKSPDQPTLDRHVIPA